MDPLGGGVEQSRLGSGSHTTLFTRMNTRQVNRLVNTINQLKPLVSPQPSGGGRAARRRRQRRRRAQTGGGQSGGLVTVPSVGGAIYRPRVPRLIAAREGVMVANTERFTTSVTTLAAGATTFNRVDLCPASLPWLNGVASNYSKYRWTNLQLFYIPACPTSQFGVVAMGLTYDDNDPTLGVTTALVQQLYRAVSGPVWAGYDGASALNSDSMQVPNGAMCCVLDCGKLDKPYYKYATTAQIAAMSTQEQGIYIPAQLLWATDNGVAATVGNIVVKYTVELIEPIPSVLND